MGDVKPRVTAWDYAMEIDKLPMGIEVLKALAKWAEDWGDLSHGGITLVVQDCRVVNLETKRTRRNT